jgi:DNA-directed RNA polymerase subunit M/transcription elongation factor TFIIS
MPPTLSTVLLSTKGECRKINIPLTADGALSMEIIQKYLKKKEQPEVVCQYEYDNKVFFLFGYKKGKKGTENKTELPPPYTGTALFGDIIIITSLNHTWDSPIPCTTEQWNSFYQEEDIEDDLDDEKEDDDEKEEEEKEDDDTVVKDDFDDSDTEKELDKDLDKDDLDKEDEVEPIAVKRRRAPVYTKVDTSALKEEIAIDSPLESSKIRLATIKILSFLEGMFKKEDIESLERAIFESSYQFAQKQYIARNWKAVSFCEVYRQLVRSVVSNIHPKSPVQNARLLKRIEEGEFTLSAIPFMTAYDMFPEKWFALKDKLLQREQKILEGNKSRATDQFKCRRCQKRECTYYELQTRSADEPMTIFITCLNCGKEWRQGG